jgi:hypothetical protein
MSMNMPHRESQIFASVTYAWHSPISSKCRYGREAWNQQTKPSLPCEAPLPGCFPISSDAPNACWLLNLALSDHLSNGVP